MNQDWMNNLEITPAEVKRRLDSGESLMLVDVREAWEVQTCSIDGATNIPLREIPTHLEQLEEAENIVVFCHHGMRSLDAAAWLKSQGVAAVRSMTGGIDRWSLEIDASVPRY
jgi:rhodanese-related sulfurtransferase